MPALELNVAPASHRLRLDRYLRDALPEGTSRGEVVRRIQAGLVSVNGTVVRQVDWFVKKGDRVVVAEPAPAPPPPVLEASAFLLVDDAIVAIDKPPGLPSLATPAGEPSACAAVEAVLADGRRLHSVHRLDRETSGVLLLARDPPGAAALGREFARGRVEKVYLAVVAGHPEHDHGRIDAPLAATPSSRHGRIEVARNGREAVTDWRVLERREATSLLEVRPRTGRRHQVRAHLRHLGHPVVGDARYGGPPADRLMLHARSLRFRHPRDGREVALEASVPEGFGTD